MYTHLDREFYPELQDRKWRTQAPTMLYVLFGLAVGVVGSMSYFNHIIGDLIQ